MLSIVLIFLHVFTSNFRKGYLRVELSLVSCDPPVWFSLLYLDTGFTKLKSLYCVHASTS